MPLPIRNKGETRSAFVDRCMGDEAVNREFPDAEQRYAVCESQADKPVEAADAGGAFALTCGGQDITFSLPDSVDAGDTIPCFRMVAYTGVPMTIKGWRAPVVVDLATVHIPRQCLPVRFGHAARHGVGHTERIAVVAGADGVPVLVAEGRVSRDTPEAREVVTSGKRGFPWRASIGAEPIRARFVRQAEPANVNGRTLTGPLYVVEARLGEISFVDRGADDDTSVAIVAGQRKDVVDEDDKAPQTTDSPVEPDEPIEAGKAPVVTDDAASKPRISANVAELRQLEAAEADRCAAIHKLCTGRADDMASRAIKAGWTPEQCELEILREKRPAAPAIHAGHDVRPGVVLEAACALAGGLPEPEELYPEPILDAANKRWGRTLGLGELLLEAARANGYTGGGIRRDLRGVLNAAFAPQINAAFSTVEIGGILSNIANKFLLAGFNSVERAWREICAVRNVIDFKTVTSYRLIGGSGYQKVAPGGEIKHGSLGEVAYTNKAETYGELLAVTRQDIINDDLGAISLVPRKIGRDGALKINDVFWAIFLDNAAFFKAANGNYLEGADTALGVNALTKAEETFMGLKDPDGNPLGVNPAILLVAAANAATASVLMKSAELRDTTSDKKYPTSNPHTGKFRPVVSRYLSMAKYEGFSSKAWYLLADPADLAAIEVAFLFGQESPTIETADADFDRLGIRMRGYHDFGVALQEPRAGVKAKGEA